MMKSRVFVLMILASVAWSDNPMMLGRKRKNIDTANPGICRKGENGFTCPKAFLRVWHGETDIVRDDQFLFFSKYLKTFYLLNVDLNKKLNILLDQHIISTGTAIICLIKTQRLFGIANDWIWLKVDTLSFRSFSK